MRPEYRCSAGYVVLIRRLNWNALTMSARPAGRMWRRASTGYASKRSLNGGLIASTKKTTNAYTPSANAANVITPREKGETRPRSSPRDFRRDVACGAEASVAFRNYY